MAHELQSCGHDNIQGFFKISFHSLIDSVAPSLSMEFSVLLGWQDAHAFSDENSRFLRRCTLLFRSGLDKLTAPRLDQMTSSQTDQKAVGELALILLPDCATHRARYSCPGAWEESVGCVVWALPPAWQSPGIQHTLCTNWVLKYSDIPHQSWWLQLWEHKLLSAGRAATMLQHGGADATWPDGGA